MNKINVSEAFAIFVAITNPIKTIQTKGRYAVSPIAQGKWQKGKSSTVWPDDQGDMPWESGTRQTSTSFFDARIGTDKPVNVPVGDRVHTRGILSNPIGIQRSEEYKKLWTPLGQSGQSDYLPSLSQKGRKLRDPDTGQLLWPSTGPARFAVWDESNTLPQAPPSSGGSHWATVPGTWRPARTTGIQANIDKQKSIAEMEEDPGYSKYHDKIYPSLRTARERGDYVKSSYDRFNFYLVPKEGRGGLIDGWIGTQPSGNDFV